MSAREKKFDGEEQSPATAGNHSATSRNKRVEADTVDAAPNAHEVGSDVQTRNVRYTVPAPPHERAVWMTRSEAAGYLRVTPHIFGELLRLDVSFPRGHKPKACSARWSRKELDAWMLAQPRRLQHRVQSRHASSIGGRGRRRVAVEVEESSPPS